MTVPAITYLCVSAFHWGAGTTATEAKKNWTRHSWARFSPKKAQVYRSDRPVSNVSMDDAERVHWDGDPDTEWEEVLQRPRKGDRD